MTTSTQDAIYQAIPHRPPFLFIDEILELREDGATTQKHIKPDESFFEGHYPGNPIMPGVLLCEAVFQTGAVWLMKKWGNEGISAENKTPVLSRIKEAKFKNRVDPGDTLTIDASMKEQLGNFMFMKGSIRKAGKLVLTIEFALALV